MPQKHNLDYFGFSVHADQTTTKQKENCEAWLKLLYSSTTTSCDSRSLFRWQFFYGNWL